MVSRLWRKVQFANFGSGWKDKATYAVAIQATALNIPARLYMFEMIFPFISFFEGAAESLEMVAILV